MISSELEGHQMFQMSSDEKITDKWEAVDNEGQFFLMFSRMEDLF